MKKYTLLILGLLVLSLLSVALLLRMNALRDAHIAETESMLTRETALIAQTVSLALKQKLPVILPQDFGKIRITLIDPHNHVIAETAEDLKYLAVHDNRQEIIAAQQGAPTSIIRFSQTLNQPMFYHARPITTPQGTYVLRTAITTEALYARIHQVRRLLTTFILVAVISLAVLFIYFTYRVHFPLKQSLSKQKEIQSALNRRLKAQLREKETLLKAMSEGVLLLTRTGDLVFANTAARNLLTIGAPFNIARTQIEDLASLVYKRERFAGEFPCQQSLFYIQGRPLADDTTLITITDLTPLRKLESYRSDFVANVSHEIKTPLTCLMSATETLLEIPSPDPELSQRLYAIISQQAQRLNKLVQDILCLSECEKNSNALQISFSSFSLSTAILHAQSLCMERAKDANIKLTFTDQSSSNDAIIQGNLNLIEQLFINLIDNAILYSQTTHIEITLQATPTNIIATVADYGIGIASHDVSRIFERFYRVDKARNRALGGTGLGLAIARHIAIIHHGSLTLHSEVGKGATFTFTCPASSI